MMASSLTICAGGVPLPALLSQPPQPQGLGVFVHGSGSGRFSPRHQAGMAMLLVDWLTPQEAEQDRRDIARRFRIALLRDRLLDSLRWLVGRLHLAGLAPVGLFGASAGAAAALQAAAERPEAVAAVVSRGGRPDLAGEALASTLPIVAGEDGALLGLNRAAAARLRCPHRLEIVPGASPRFQEPGPLHQAVRLACDGFLSRLPGPELVQRERLISDWTAASDCLGACLCEGGSHD